MCKYYYSNEKNHMSSSTYPSASKEKIKRKAKSTFLLQRYKHIFSGGSVKYYILCQLQMLQMNLLERENHPLYYC